MKRVQNILKKHGPRSEYQKRLVICNQYVYSLRSFPLQLPGYLFTTDSNLLRILNECHHPIDQLTFSLETCVIPSEMSVFADREKFILTSIINQNCSVGISTDVPVQLVDIQERNRKKLAKLQENLAQLNERMSTEKYRKKTKPHRRKTDFDQVCATICKLIWRWIVLIIYCYYDD